MRMDPVDAEGRSSVGCILAACEESQHAFVLKRETSRTMLAESKKVHVENQTKVNHHFEEQFTDHIIAMLDIKRRIIQAGRRGFEGSLLPGPSSLNTKAWEFFKISLIEVEKAHLRNCQYPAHERSQSAKSRKLPREICSHRI
jgi:hypothetical protein